MATVETARQAVRLTREDVERLAKSFGTIPTLQAVTMTPDEDGCNRITDVEISGATDRPNPPSSGTAW